MNISMNSNCLEDVPPEACTIKMADIVDTRSFRIVDNLFSVEKIAKSDNMPHTILLFLFSDNSGILTRKNNTLVEKALNGKIIHHKTNLYWQVEHHQTEVFFFGF